MTGDNAQHVIAIAARRSYKGEIDLPERGDSVSNFAHPILLPDVRRLLEGFLGRCDSVRAHAEMVARHLGELEEVRDELRVLRGELRVQGSKLSAEILGRIRKRCDKFGAGCSNFRPNTSKRRLGHNQKEESNEQRTSDTNQG